jgi:hypothetical protein
VQFGKRGRRGGASQVAGLQEERPAELKQIQASAVLCRRRQALEGNVRSLYVDPVRPSITYIFTAMTQAVFGLEDKQLQTRKRNGDTRRYFYSASVVVCSQQTKPKQSN